MNFNELRCAIIGHGWEPGTRYYFKQVYRRDKEPIRIGVRFKICRNCGREEVQGFLEEPFAQDANEVG